MWNTPDGIGSNDIGFNPNQNNRRISRASNGSLLMSGARRDGRNPSTGARSSRRAGIATTFETGYPENFSKQNETPIY